MNEVYTIPTLPLNMDLETKGILKQLSLASRQLAELKGVAKTIPNENILINTLTLQEAKDSSEVENIITTQDDLYKEELSIEKTITNAAAKEVLRYREALKAGFDSVRKNKLLTNSVIKKIQSILEENTAGFRAVPGTTLKNGRDEIVYTPPQTKKEIEKYMSNLEKFINDPNFSDLDPLIKLAIIHHQFESIHPFYDGNGRTSRIISVLYLVTNDLLELPVLYLSRYITHNKAEYYRLLQNIRENQKNKEKDWQAWIEFMLRGIEVTAKDTIGLVYEIKKLMDTYKITLREQFGKQYKHELLNNLFNHPYTKIEFVQRDLQISRLTAAKYLDKIVKETKLLSKIKLGKTNYYINDKLFVLFMNQSKLSEHV